MIKVNNVPLIERMLHQLDKLKLKRIIVVVGFKAQTLIDFIESLDIKTEIIFVTNKNYSKTNNIYSLYLARNYLKEDETLLLESDLIFEDSILKTIIKNPSKNLVMVSKFESWMNGTVVTLGEDNNISKFISKEDFDFKDKNEYYKTVNIYKFSKDFSENKYIPFLESYCKALGKNEYYEQVLKIITHLSNSSIKAHKLLDEQKWYEIDDVQDLDIAQTLFEKPDKSYKAIQKRYGGFWRFPKLLDFCYLVNPYYPTQILMDEIKSNFEELLSSYPSNIETDNLLLSKYYNIPKENICASNGASEIIKILSETIEGTWGIISPSFDEYKNRKKDVLIFNSENKNFSYNAQDIIKHFNKEKISALVLINPDNPSGNYINKNEMDKLLAWSDNKNIKLIVDESFVDFVDKEDDVSLIKEEIIERYPNLIIIKSLSKSFGIAGLRLGLIAGKDKNLINDVKSKMPIWNINSFAEFYLQIQERYKDDYKEALLKFHKTKEKFLTELKKIKFLRVIPTQANYIMCEVLTPFTSKKVADCLLREGILIKDLSDKKGINGNQYIRIAIRDDEDNFKLTNALLNLI